VPPPFAESFSYVFGENNLICYIVLLSCSPGERLIFLYYIPKITLKSLLKISDHEEAHTSQEKHKFLGKMFNSQQLIQNL